MVSFARHTRGRPASQVDEDVVAGPDAETLAMMALRDVKKILLLDSTWCGCPPRCFLPSPVLRLTDHLVAVPPRFSTEGRHCSCWRSTTTQQMLFRRG